MLGAPISGKHLILYITGQEKSLGTLCVQEKEKEKEVTLYYLHRTLVGAELKYSPIKKTCLSLIFAIKKLKDYM